MAAPEKAFKKEVKRYIPTKTSFTSPFTPKWSPLPQEDMHFILKTLEDKLLSTGLQKKEVKRVRPWRKKGGKKPAATPEPTLPVSPQPQVHDAPKNGWTDTAARRQLAIGINEVTKALERNELKLLLVCKSVMPKHMTNHLIQLSATRGVPACQVPRLSQSVSEPLGLTSVLALGFRRCASKEEELFTDIVDAITPRVPSLDVAWLQSAAPSVTPRDCVDGGEEEEKEEEEAAAEVEKKGQKRKHETVSKEVTESDPRLTLQPLKVRKVVANSARKRKRKAKSQLVK